MIDRITKGDANTLIRQWFKPGWTVIDVGAGDGDTVQSCIDAVGARGIVHAVEPDRRNVTALERFNGSVHVHPVAARDHDGLVRFFEAVSPLVSACYRGAVDSAMPAADVIVDGRRLDSLIPRAQGLKIDAQGSECAILDGAAGLLPSVQALIIEAWPVGLRAAGRSVDELWEQLQSAGLPPRWPLTDDLVTRDEVPLLETRCKFANWVCRR